MTAKPVILQVIPELDTGGAERTVIEVAEAIAAAGGQALVASEGGRLEGELAAAGGELVRLPVASKNPLTILANAGKLQGLIATRNVSLLHARSRAPAWSALLAARRAGVPFVTTYHGIYNQKGRVKGWYNGVMARGDIVIANSAYTAGIVKQRHNMPEQRLRVIPRGVDLARFSRQAVSPDRLEALRSQWGVDENARLVVLAARLTRWKGQHVAIGAAESLAKQSEFDDVVFILAGDDQGRSDYKASLEARMSGSGLAGRVRLTGHCEDVPAAFAAASLALVPSIEPEAFGRTSIEAQAMGCPVIVSDIGALPETMVDAGRASSAGEATGWRFPPADHDALAGRIAEALRLSDQAALGMKQAARQRVCKMFSKEVLQQSTLRVYDNLLSGSMVSEFERKCSQIEDSPQWLCRTPV